MCLWSFGNRGRRQTCWGSPSMQASGPRAEMPPKSGWGKPGCHDFFGWFWKTLFWTSLHLDLDTFTGPGPTILLEIDGFNLDFFWMVYGIGWAPWFTTLLVTVNSGKSETVKSVREKTLNHPPTIRNAIVHRVLHLCRVSEHIWYTGTHSKLPRYIQLYKYTLKRIEQK